MTTYTIYERGNGLPGVGERVYDASTGDVLEITSIDSHILTRQWAANRIVVTASVECHATDLDDEEFGALRDVRVSRGADMPVSE